MAFRTGTVAYARFRLIGDAPQRIDETILERLREHVLKPSAVGVPPEMQAGWSAGGHIFDVDFAPEQVAFGDDLLIGARLDTNKVPADVRNAYRRLAERAAASESPTGAINKSEREAAREEADHKCRQELADGRYRKSKLLPVLWNLREQLVLAPAFTDVAVTALNDLFRTSFDCVLRPLSAGALALEILDERGLMRDYEDCTPTPFTSPPDHVAAEHEPAATPTVPWSLAGPEPKDFLGNEFLIWLWRRVDDTGGLIRLPGSDAAGALGAVIDRTLDMQCAWDVTGTQALRADGPTQLPEAREALRHGKWPRKLGLTMSIHESVFQLALQGDRFNVSASKLPRPEHAASQREQVELRLEHLESLDKSLLNLFTAFLELRFSSDWASERDDIAQWISGRPQKVASKHEHELQMNTDRHG